MDAPQGDLDKLSISQLESILADRRRRESKRIMRQIAGRQPEKGESEYQRKPTPPMQGLAAPPRRPDGGRITAPLTLPAHANDAALPIAPHAALFGPERFNRAGLAATVTPRKERGPAWLRKKRVQKAIDVSLLLAEVGFVVLLLWVLAQWLFTDAQVTADPSVIDHPAIALGTSSNSPGKPGLAGAAYQTATRVSATATTTLTPAPTGTATPDALAQAAEERYLGPDRVPAPPGAARGLLYPGANTPTPTITPTPDTAALLTEQELLAPDRMPAPLGAALRPLLPGAHTLTPTAVPATPTTDPRYGPDLMPAQPGSLRGPTLPLIAEEDAQPSATPDAFATPTDTPTVTVTPTDSATPTDSPTPSATTTPTVTATPTIDPTQKQPINISIPKIKLDARVRDVELKMSDDEAIWEVADFMAGHHTGSANPGEQGNMVIAGHRDIRGSVFLHLDQLQPGDEIFVSSGLGVYRYVVRSSIIVRPDEVSVMAWKPDSRLTLITCTPVKIASHRLIVVADLDPTYVSPRGQ